MAFRIVHELRGTFADGDEVAHGRMRCRCGWQFSQEEADRIADGLAAIKGIPGVQLNPVTGSVLFYYTDDTARLGALRLLDKEGDAMDALRASGVVVDPAPVPKLEGPAAAAMEVATHYILKPFMPLWWSIPSAIWHAIPYIWKGIKDLVHGRVRVSVLDAAAVLVCLLRRDFSTCRTLTLLLGVGDKLEDWTKQKSLDSLADSLALTAESIWVRDADGTERQVRMSEIGEGDIVVIRSGSSIPVDGVVVDGEAVVNQAAMTGEPIGVIRKEGNSVFAGTVVEEGDIAVRVTKVGDQTRLNQIVKFIEESETLKAGIQGKFERMADMAVPFTFGLAALVWILTRDPIRASSVLLVDYSCALKLSTPLAVLAAMREGAEHGCVIKGGRYLESLAEADTIVFDKTGTLTNATPHIAEVIAAPGFNKDEVLMTMACLEEHFPHPVARAVVRAAEEAALPHPEEHDEVQYIVAHGVCSLLHGEKVVVGSRHYVETDEQVDLTPLLADIDAQAALGRSLLYVAQGGKIAGLVAIEDPPRPEASTVIRQLREEGVDRILMITGDDARTAKAMAARMGITEFKAQVLPTDKSDVVTALTNEGRKVMMTGDGINDAPALSAASVGIAMTDGTDLAKGVANVLLTEPTLSGIVTARRLSRSTMRRIHSNFVMTMFFNSLFLAGGIFMILSPALSALLHNATTLALTVRAMRRHLPKELPAETRQEAV